jgi:hypothetical protein
VGPKAASNRTDCALPKTGEWAMRGSLNSEFKSDARPHRAGVRSQLVTHRPRFPAPLPTRASATRSAFDSLVVRDEYALLCMERFVLFSWRTRATWEGARAYVEAVQRVHAELGVSVGCAVYFGEAADVVYSPEVRRELVRGFAGQPGSVAATAWIRPGGGFPAASLRSSITSIRLAQGKAAHDMAHFTRIAAGVDWLGQKLSTPYTVVNALVRTLGLLAEGSFDALCEGWGSQQG